MKIQNKKVQQKTGKQTISLLSLFLLLVLSAWFFSATAQPAVLAAPAAQTGRGIDAINAASAAFDFSATLSSNAATYLDEDKPDNNYETSAILSNRTEPGKTRRSLVGFDLSSLPGGPDINVTSATMTFTTDSGKDEHRITVYPLLEDWNETEATWNHRKTSPTNTVWSGGGGGGAAGGASIGSSSAGFFDPAVNETEYAVNTAAMASLVQDWIDTTSGIDHNGVILISSGNKAKDEVKLLDSVTLEVDYSCPTLANLGNRVWDDKNSNGVQDAGETGLVDLTVRLLNSAGDPTGLAQQTGIGGKYSFDCLQPGSYIVEVELPAVAGLAFSPKQQGANPGLDSDINPGSGRTDIITLSSGENNNTIDAGITGLNLPDGGVNGLFYGDGDHERYTLLTTALNDAGSFWGLVETNGATKTMRVAFLGDPYLMNDNVFDDKSADPDPTEYMASVGWEENRDLDTLHNSERLIDIEFTCLNAAGETIGSGDQWTQSYMCKAGELDDLYGTNLGDYTGPLTGAGGLQELVQFQPADNLASSAANSKSYEFLDCGRDSGDPFGDDALYTAATSLAWNMNNTTFEPDQGPGDSSDAWKSPFSTAAGFNDTPLDFQYPYFDMVNRWEWTMIYEMAFDVSACSSDLTIIAADIHNSPGKVFDDATFTPGVLEFYDWGDLPDGSYPTTGVTAARHQFEIVAEAYLGSVPPDTETAGQPSTGANGDDNDANGDDEDGIVLLSPLLPGSTGKIQVIAGTDGYLSAFIDFDNDGTLDTVTIATSSPTGVPGNLIGDLQLGAGTHEIWINVPASTSGPLYGRFRFTENSGEGGNSPSGLASTGEVEDYLLSTPGAIGNFVWNDENSDGFQDAGEPGLANVIVELYRDNGDGSRTLISSTVTDAHGGYLFDKLLPGDYFVDVDETTLPDGMSQTALNLPNADFGNQDHSSNGYAVTLVSGEENLTADFGYNWGTPNDPPEAATGAIGDRVWIDSDGDGFQDPNEAGLGGVEVCIRYDSNQDGIIDGTDNLYTAAIDQNGSSGTGCTITETDGSYIFHTLPVGQYVIEVTPPSGYSQTGDPDHFGTSGGANDNKTTTPIILAPGDVFLNADFGYQPDSQPNGRIGDAVWFDANGDGSKDGGEPGIPGVTVALALDVNGNGSIDAGEIIATTTSAADGSYIFEGLPLDDGGGDNDADYLVQVTDTDNVLGELVKTTGPAPGSNNNSQVLPYPVTLSSAAQVNLTADFGYAPPGHDEGDGLIGDTVFLDVNNNDAADPGEGIEGVTVILKDDNGDTVATTVTDENGNYSFGDLDPDGTYTVVVDTSTLPPGLSNTWDWDTPGAPDNQSTVDLGTDGPVNLDQDFAYQPAEAPGSIGNQIWIDTDADGEYESGSESGIGGVTLDLYYDSNGNGQVDPGEPKIGSTTTAGDGTYLFSNLPTADNGAGPSGADYIVDVTDVNGVLAGYWHSLGTPKTNNQSQVDPYAASISSAAPNNLTADFGYYIKPGSVGNFVWLDDGSGLSGVEEDGIFNEPATNGSNGFDVILTIDYPNGAQLVLKTVTGPEPGTGNPGWYHFDNLLLDEDYKGDYSGSDANEPQYTLTVPGISSTSTYKGLLDPLGVGNGVDNNADYQAGERGFPAQGTADDTNDFGYSEGVTAVSLQELSAIVPATGVNAVGIIAAALLLVSGLVVYLTRRPRRPA